MPKRETEEEKVFRLLRRRPFEEVCHSINEFHLSTDLPKQSKEYLAMYTKITTDAGWTVKEYSLELSSRISAMMESLD